LENGGLRRGEALVRERQYGDIENTFPFKEQMLKIRIQ
jgi:hypothetical protein